MTWCPGEALLIKMWESLVDRGIGGLLRPWQMRREASALTDVHAEEKLKLAQTEMDLHEILGGRARFDGNNIVKNLSKYYYYQ